MKAPSSPFALRPCLHCTAASSLASPDLEPKIANFHPFFSVPALSGHTGNWLLPLLSFLYCPLSLCHRYPVLLVCCQCSASSSARLTSEVTLKHQHTTQHSLSSLSLVSVSSPKCSHQAADLHSLSLPLFVSSPYPISLHYPPKAMLLLRSLTCLQKIPTSSSVQASAVVSRAFHGYTNELTHPIPGKTPVKQTAEEAVSVVKSGMPRLARLYCRLCHHFTASVPLLHT